MLLKTLKTQHNIICVKYGTKYNSDHVNRMYKMVEKNCSLPFTFFCMTENSEGIDPRVNIIPLDMSLDLESYWWKICLFNLDIDTPTLYFDLDIVIQNNFDFMFNGIKQNKVILLRNEDYGFTTGGDYIIGGDKLINSSVVGFIPSQHKDMFKSFMKNPDYNIVKYFGLDRYITCNHNEKLMYLNYKYWYHRWKGGQHYDPTKVTWKNGLPITYDPDKIFCILSQATPDQYEGLEKYFL